MARQTGRKPTLSDGDAIAVDIQTNVVRRGLVGTKIEVVLGNRTASEWWKAIRVPFGPRPDFYNLEVSGRTGAAVVLTPADVAGDSALVFRKAKLLGRKCDVYRLPLRGRLQPNSRVIFTWSKD
jgi:hypothetical protein